MKKWKKGSMAIAAFLAATISVTGCAGGGGGTGAAAPAAPAAGGNTTAAGGDSGAGAAAPAASGELAQLSFSWWGNDDRHQATQAAIDAFNKAHEGAIAVTGEPSGFGNLDETFATRYAGGTAADVMTVNFPWLIKYSPDGTGFYDLNQVADIIDLTQYDPAFLETGMTGGVLQAIPYGQNTLGVYLNKSAFERTGITTLPATFEDYKAAAQTVTAQDPNAYLIVSPTFRFAAIYYLQQKTGKGEFDENLNPNYTLEDYKEAMAWYKEMADLHVFCSRQDYLENVGNDPVSIAQNPKYISGGYLGVLEWTGGIASNAQTLTDQGDELVVAELPTIDGAVFKGTMAKPSLTFAISKDSKNPRAAAEFMQYILNDPEGIELMGSTRGMVASKIAVETLSAAGKITGPVQQAYDFTETAEVINNSPIFEDAVFGSAYESSYEQFELGALTVDEAAQQYYDEVTAHVAKLKVEYGK